MSCAVALAVTLMLSDPNVALAAAQPPAAAEAPVSVAGEPLFADIVAQSGAMRNIVRRWIETGRADDAAFGSSPEFEMMARGAASLAERDMQGHLILKERGTDGDLKCILRGIAEDMPLKVEAVRAATTPTQRRSAMEDLAYLLNDNVEVITAPPQPPV